jgi:hypothetical protein
LIRTVAEVPQYWLKPLGVTQPYDPMPNAWTIGADLDAYPLTTGPATLRQPPQMGRGDQVLFHAVIHVRLFAAGEIIDRPRWQKDPQYGDRWPWLYPCRVDTWVPMVEHGPRTSEIAPKRAFGRIQRGGDFARLTRNEYEAMLGALAAVPEARTR